jgi:predicted Zn finger-like uncharacterized protein
MAISVRCDDCAARFAVKDNLAGKLIRCPDCKAKIVVPSGPAEDDPESTVPSMRKDKGGPAKNRRAVGSAPSQAELDQAVDPSNSHGGGWTKASAHAVLAMYGGLAVEAVGYCVFRYGYVNVAGLTASGLGFFIMFLGALFLILGTMIFIWACAAYANSKGQSRVLSLVGIINVGSLAVVTFPEAISVCSAVFFNVCAFAILKAAILMNRR